jgi:uncharacterized protein (DUF2147 family)
MRVKTAALIVSSFAALALNVASVRAAEPTAAGLWQQVNDAGQVEGWFLIFDHNGTYEGVIARMFQKPGEDPNAVCVRCVDDRKDKPWLGLPLIRGMKQQGLNYEGGNILDPRDGTVYRALMRLSPDGQTLTVRGFLGIALLGQDQTWKRLPEAAMKDVDPGVRAKYVPAAAPAPTPPPRPANRANASPKGSEPKGSESPR